MNPLEKIKLIKELKVAVDNRNNESNPIKKIKLIKEIQAIRTKLGFVKVEVKEELPPQEVVMEEPQEVAVEEPEKVTVSPLTEEVATFDYTEQANTIAKRQKINNECEDIVKAVQDGELDINDITAEQKATLSQFSGYGGGVKNERKGTVGSGYEYYTPKEIAAQMWDLAEGLGFKGGKVLDPCAGTGIFSATAPKDGVLIDSVELDSTSGTINKILFNDDKHTTTISPFEKVATDTSDETYDLVIANVPFGDNSSRGSNKMFDERYQSQSLDGYFILRSLDKLKPNGLAVFMSGTTVMSGKDKNKTIRKLASEKAEFIGAYRLPNKLFNSAGADVITDVLVFKKHNKLNEEIIQELKQGNVKVLQEANVYYKPFIEGKYFTENKRNILGEEVMARSRYGTDVMKVVNDDSIGNIAKLMKRLGGSRIDWDLLQGTEPEIINYKNGDIVYQGGIAKEWQDGRFINAKLAVEELDEDFRNRVAQYGDIVSIVENSVDLDVLIKDSEQVQARAMSDSLSDDQRITFQFAREHGANNVFFGLKAFDMVSHEEAGKRVNMLAKYPNISSFCKAIVLGGIKARGLKGEFKALFDKVKKTTVVYDKKSKAYNPLWLGQEQEMEDVVLDDTQKYEQMLYTIGAGFGLNGGVPIAEFKAKFPNVDLDNTEEWCYSLDGNRIISADDYYQGVYGQFKDAHLKAIEETDDQELVTKLKRQLTNAESRLEKAEIEKMRFDITSRYVDMSKKLDFLNKYFSGSGKYVVNKNGDGIEYKPSGSGTPNDREATLKRLAIYVNKSSFSTGAKDEKTRKIRAKMLKQLVVEANAQFNAWIKSQPSEMSILEDKINKPEYLTFKATENTSTINVRGLNKDFKLHGYQSDYVRKQSRQMGGICGFDVGLGKTFTALATVQHLQSIGVKKKTLFVVPNTTLTNWRKESQTAYTPDVFEKCLFVGVREKNGKLSVKSSDVPKDIALISKNEHNKIYMSFEAFTAILMSDKHIDSYAQEVVRSDANKNKIHLESEVVKKDSDVIKLAKQLKSLMSDKYDFLENMGVDSIVIDEAHTFKNAKAATFGGRVKWLSLAPASARGLNMMLKTWYIRGKTPKNDGVLCLTATPVTNSPLEVYSMLSLAMGEESVKNMSGLQNADDFLEATCLIEQREELDITGTPIPTEVFAGLKSTAMLRKLLNATATIRNAENTPEAKSEAPEGFEVATPVPIESYVKKEMDKATLVYKLAKAQEKSGPTLMSEDQLKLLASEASRTGETIKTLAHPFNFISKLSKMMLDMNLYNEETVYHFAKDDLQLAIKVADEFNKKNFKDERTNLTGIDPEQILSEKEKLSDGSEENYITVYTIKVKADIVLDSFVLTTTDFDIQSKFLDLCEKNKLKVNCSVGAKVAALIENVNKEKANPKDYKGGNLAKQIIFCDLLGVHHNIKIALSEQCNIPANKIQIINAKSVKDQGALQEIQDGFNAFGDENKYELIIANKKAEVGINLQKGCQAIHHLTIGWTPDSLQQRNGRGVRQGNDIEDKKVTIYYYDTDGSFDAYKRKLVNNKATWIDDLLHGEDETVAIESEILSNEEIELLADANGSAEEFAKVEAKIQEMKKAQRLKSNRKNFETVLGTYKVAMNESRRTQDFETFVRLNIAEFRDSLDDLSDDLDKIVKIDRELASWRITESKEEALKGRKERIQGTINYMWKNIYNKNKRYFIQFMHDDADKGINREQLSTLKYDVLYSDKTEQELLEQEKNGGVMYDDYLSNKANSEKFVSEIFAKISNLSDGAEIEEYQIEQIKNENYVIFKDGIYTDGDIVQVTIKGSGKTELCILTRGSWRTKINLRVLKELDDGKFEHTTNSYEDSDIESINKRYDTSDVLAVNIYKQLAEQDLEHTAKGFEGTLFYKRYPIVAKYIDEDEKVEFNLSSNSKFSCNGGVHDFIAVPSDFSDIETLQAIDPTLANELLATLNQRGLSYTDGKCYLTVNNDLRVGMGKHKRTIFDIAFLFALRKGLTITNKELIPSSDTPYADEMLTDKAFKLIQIKEIDYTMADGDITISDKTDNSLFTIAAKLLVKYKVFADMELAKTFVRNSILSGRVDTWSSNSFGKLMGRIAYIHEHK